MICIREVTGSSAGRDTGHPDRAFSWLSSIPSEKLKDSALSSTINTFSHIPFNFFYLYIVFLQSTQYTYRE
jgi:hypothetical protein